MLHDFTGYSAFVFNLRKLVGSATSAKLDFHKILSGAAKWLATKTRRVLRNLFSWLSLLDLFGLAGRSRAKAADIRSGPSLRSDRAHRIAIADFDGGLRPDKSGIQAAQSDSSPADYWIQLQLSAAGWQSIRGVGPVGGFLIEARDVNGDHAVALVLSTAWRRQPVTILLNDGHSVDDLEHVGKRAT